MFKAARWRTEKHKTKAVFKLQFYAAKVPPTGTEAVMVSLVPADASRPTARTERVAAVEGACSWGSPVYETVKLVRNPKTGKVDEKVYRFLVSAAESSKAEILGEASINMANYAEVFKASSLALPLKGSNTGAILHITIQRMQGDGDGREGDEDGGMIVKRQRRTLESQLSKCDDEYSSQDGSHIKNQTQAKFSSNRNMPVDNAGYNGDLQKSRSFDAVSVSGSDTSSGIYTPRENGMKNNNIRKDPTSFLSPLINSDTPKMVVFSSDDLSATSAPDRITDASTNSPGDAGSNETSRDSEESIEKLRSDIDILSRKLEVSELELQTLRKQIIKENKRVQDLSSDLNSLKEERDTLKRICDELKLSEKRKRFEAAPADTQLDGEDHLSLLEEVREELDCEKNLNVHLRLQLKMTQEANSELLLALKDLDGMLEQRNKESLCVKCSEMEMKTKTRMETVATKLGNGVPHLQKPECELLLETQSDNEEQYALDALVNERDDSKTAHSMDNKILDLNNEVEFYMKEREDLEMHMEQLALDYEILKQENHDVITKLEQMQLREQLRMQYECSAHLAVISDLESRVEFLEQELEKQAEAFEADIETTTLAKVELEKRAILAEEELRKTKWNHSNDVDRLQEELRGLSAHLSSTFGENEKIVMQTLKENAELRAQRSTLVELLEKSNKELAFLQDKHSVKFKQLAGLIDFKSKEADRLLEKLNDKKRELENYKMSEEARKTDSLEELHLLKTETEKLKLEKSLLSKEKEEKEKLLVEMKELRTSLKGSHIALQEKELEIELLKKEKEAQMEEVGKLLNEINDLRHIKDDKDTIVAVLNSEEAALGVQYNDMNQALYENELVKNIKKSISPSKNGFLDGKQITTNCWVENTDDNCTTTNKNDGEQFYENSKCRDYHEQPKEDKMCIHEMNGIVKELQKRYSGSDLDEDKPGLLSCSYDQKRLANVLSEMEALKEQNNSMESELKEMQERYSEISLKFAEVEGERQQLLMTIRSLKNSLKC